MIETLVSGKITRAELQDSPKSQGISHDATTGLCNYFYVKMADNLKKLLELRWSNYIGIQSPPWDPTNKFYVFLDNYSY